MKPKIRVVGIDNSEIIDIKNYKMISMKEISKKNLKRNVKFYIHMLTIKMKHNQW